MSRLKTIVQGYKRSYLQKLLLMISLFFLNSIFINKAYSVENVKFSGVLIEEPCQLELLSKYIVVNMEHIDDRFLFDHNRSVSTPFSLQLSGCDPDVAKIISITFTGQESAWIPGLLSVNNQLTNRPNGIALGLQSAGKIDIPLFMKVKVADLIDGYNEIKLGAYIQAELPVMVGRPVVYGRYQVTAGFTIDYE